MWKYVSRRIRDVYDKTAHVLEVPRNWNCGASERFCGETPPQDATCAREQQEADGKRYCLLHVARPNQLGQRANRQYGTGSNQSDQEGTKRKEYHQAPFEHSWLGAITWTSAIICGWYTTQLLCLNRRTRRYDHSPFGKGLTSQLLYAASEHRRLSARHCELLAHHFGLRSAARLADPFPKPSITDASWAAEKEQKRSNLVESFASFIPYDGHDFVDYTDQNRTELQRFVFQINNETKPVANVPRDEFVSQNEPNIPVAEVSSPAKGQTETIDDAFKSLLTVLGEIEYQLGLRNLELGEFESAVSHLKLGTSHHHAGAAFNLGICFEQGYGMPKDMRMALECYQQAAEQGHPQAIYNVGVFHARGYAGLRPSRSMAKKYFLAAAELGLEEAIATLGPKYQRTRKQSLVDNEVQSSGQVEPSFQFAIENVDQFHAEKYYPEQPNSRMRFGGRGDSGADLRTGRTEVRIPFGLFPQGNLFTGNKLTLNPFKYFRWIEDISVGWNVRYVFRQSSKLNRAFAFRVVLLNARLALRSIGQQYNLIHLAAPLLEQVGMIVECRYGGCVWAAGGVFLLEWFDSGRLVLRVVLFQHNRNSRCVLGVGSMLVQLPLRLPASGRTVPGLSMLISGILKLFSVTVELLETTFVTSVVADVV
uniref:Uncharacterized protein n=1 Tax=Anopheles culicifacies TaxID=139723 RepID=A0A182MU91_9DIPT